MDIDWNDPRVVSLHERIAATVQREQEDNSLSSGGIADPDLLGARVASVILAAATAVQFGSTAWKLSFAPDPRPARGVRASCLLCAAPAGELHRSSCRWSGVVRQLGRGVQL